MVKIPLREYTQKMNKTTTLKYYAVLTTMAYEEIPRVPLTPLQAWCLVAMASVVLILGSPLSTLVGYTSSILAKKEYSSFINCLIALYNISVGKNIITVDVLQPDPRKPDLSEIQTNEKPDFRH